MNAPHILNLGGIVHKIENLDDKQNLQHFLFLALFHSFMNLTEILEVIFMAIF